MIVVCVEPTEPYGGISVRGLSESKLCVRLERSGDEWCSKHVAACDKQNWIFSVGVD